MSTSFITYLWFDVLVDEYSLRHYEGYHYLYRPFQPTFRLAGYSLEIILWSPAKEILWKIYPATFFKQSYVFSYDQTELSIPMIDCRHHKPWYTT